MMYNYEKFNNIYINHLCKNYSNDIILNKPSLLLYLIYCEIHFHNVEFYIIKGDKQFQVIDSLICINEILNLLEYGRVLLLWENYIKNYIVES